MSDQWGQPQQPQNPYGQQPAQGGPYGQQPPSPYGQQPQSPYDQPTNPYGQQPPSPYGQQQPQSPYGQQQPQNPYGQPQGQYPGQPQAPNPYGQPQGQFPGQPGYGAFPAPVAPKKSKKGLLIGGAVALVVIVVAAVALTSKSGAAGGTATQAQTCAGYKTVETNDENSDPANAGQMLTEGQQEQTQISTLANNAQPGPLKTSLQKFDSDMNTMIGYLKANPNTDLTGTTDPPAQLIADATSLEADAAAIDAVCGLPNPLASLSD